MSITFLSKENVMRIHAHQVDTYGGQHGLRDENLLESALAMPAMTFGGEFLHKSIAEMAGAYMFHLTMNHPFLDGNKRIGTATAIVFLEANGYRFTAPEDTLRQFAWKLASGEVEKDQVIAFLQQWIQPRT